jgi:hypothetical protein
MIGSAAFRTGAIPGGAAMPSYLRDPDVADYIRRVEAADGNLLEPLVKAAIGNFVLGCKADGIWNAIKASCILAGARTLNGALVPLVGTAPTNFNFVSGDYNRKTGLVGDASTKYLNSNRAGNADPQNSFHQAVYGTTFNVQPTAANIRAWIGSEGATTKNAGLFAFGTVVFGNTRCNPLTNQAVSGVALLPGFHGASRSSSVETTIRFNTISFNDATASQAPDAEPIRVFSIGLNNENRYASNARLAFYSIGESLDLALLDARVTDLINAFGAAIP